MRLLRSHLAVAILIIGMSAVSASSSPIPAAKKKAKPTTSSKAIQTSSRSKSKKPQKEEPKQARNSRQTRGAKPLTATKNVAAESKNSTLTVVDASSRKGKKGFAGSTTQASEAPSARVVPPPVYQQKTVIPATPISTPVTSPGPGPGPSVDSRSSPPTRTVDSDNQPSAPLPVAPTSSQPDRVEVIEYRDASRSASGVSSAPPPANRIFGISSRRVDVDIDTPRVFQIQKALKDKGFYSFEPTGVYDEDTLNAMKAFQQSEHIDVTGYPTAHALKRLGL